MEGIATETESHRIRSRKWRSALEDGPARRRQITVAVRGDPLSE
jgi:hypothetical protein